MAGLGLEHSERGWDKQMGMGMVNFGRGLDMQLELELTVEERLKS